LALEAGHYRFAVSAEGGVRLWVGDRLLVDRWDGPRVNASPIMHAIDGEYGLKLEYNDPGGRASVGLSWKQVRFGHRAFLPLAMGGR
jgi:hypothetical protein